MLATSTGELKAAPVVMYIVHYTVLVPETKGLKICWDYCDLGISSMNKQEDNEKINI
jgi:hypothetical protein